MSLEAAIMGFLAEQPRSGYDLKTRCFDQDVEALWTADQAQIYRTLERLSALRLVTCTRRRQVGKPDRKVYRLTDDGEHALRTWQVSSLPLPPERDAFLLQVFFSDALDDRQIVENLVARRSAHQSRLEHLRAEAAAHASGGASLRTASLRVAAFDGAIARECSAIDWLDDTIEAIENDRLPALDRSSGHVGDAADSSSA